MKADKKIRILWKVNRLEPEWASVRIRTLIPALQLEKNGCRIRLGETLPLEEELKQADIVIINKSFTQQDVELAERAKALHKPLIVDLCDNIFIDNYTVLGEEALSNFKQISLLADKVVTTNETLADIISRNIDGKVSMAVIPDAFDDPDAVKVIYDRLYGKELLYIPAPPAFTANKGFTRLLYNIYLTSKYIKSRYINSKNRLRYYIYVLYDILANGSLEKDRKVIIWFGNKGGSHGKFGVICLQDIIEHLEKVNKTIPVQLLVVSRGYFYFKEMTRTFSIPCHFRRWHIKEFTRLIEQADLCIIPNSRDKFSITKSNNRAVLSIMLGTPVVADSIPTLEAFSDSICLDNWQQGLYAYLTDKEKVSRDINKGQELVSRHYASHKVAEAWLNLFSEFCTEGAC